MAATNTTVVALLGELFQTGKRPNTFLRMIGGIQGGILTTASREFPTNVLYALRTPGQNVALEGANAPAATGVSVSQATNVIQIHQEAVGLTYLGASDKTVTGVIPIPQAAANGPVINPRSMEFQVGAKMEVVQRDCNFSWLQGVYQNPGDATATALKTRGILTAITTNAFDQSADALATDQNKQYRGYVNQLIKAVVLTNGFNPDMTWTIFGDTTEFQNCCAAFAAAGTVFLMPEQEIVGVKVRRVVTNLGTFNLALDPDMPAQTLGLFDLGIVSPVGLPVPEKGVLFMEALAKTGSVDNMQIYGQLGLDHGPEFCHGKIKVPAMALN